MAVQPLIFKCVIKPFFPWFASDLLLQHTSKGVRVLSAGVFPELQSPFFSAVLLAWMGTGQFILSPEKRFTLKEEFFPCFTKIWDKVKSLQLWHWRRELFTLATWRMLLINLPCLICSNNCTLVPGMDWFSSLCTDVTRMGRLVQTAALPGTHTVPGMETLVPDMPPLLKGKKKTRCAVKILLLARILDVPIHNLLPFYLAYHLP